jgi:hypothetical protein
MEETMEGWRDRKLRLATAPVAVAVLMLSAANLRADLLCARGTKETSTMVNAKINLAEYYVAADHCRNLNRYTPLDAKSVMTGLKREWQAIREDLTRSVVEATLTMFFIKSGGPPKGNPPPPKTNPPPTGQGNNPPPPPPPPPPGGQGEEPGGGPPPVDPPPSATPEPAGSVLAIFAAGFVSFCGWRQRRRKKPQMNTDRYR